MIPIRDYNKTKGFSFFNWLILITNIVIFVYQVKMNDRELNEFIMKYAFIPQRFFQDPLTYFYTLITAMFLHGGFIHLIGNMLFLYVFGDNVEDALGHLRYLVFYFLGGIIASLVQVFFTNDLSIPNIGASGAISAVIASYMVLFPGAKIVTIVPIFIFLYTINVPAIIFLFVWFIIQFFSGVAQIYEGQFNNVAYWAHIGGFIFGLFYALVGRKKYLKKYRNFDYRVRE
ncbi:MAG: rhomboid family intramembrane serine protease [Spirochaetes bacterium]|nr:rhomboid family intramembrane serine protease [Spirochaetota bacterium]